MERRQGGKARFSGYIPVLLVIRLVEASTGGQGDGERYSRTTRDVIGGESVESVGSKMNGCIIAQKHVEGRVEPPPSQEKAENEKRKCENISSHKLTRPMGRLSQPVFCKTRGYTDPKTVASEISRRDLSIKASLGVALSPRSRNSARKLVTLSPVCYDTVARTLKRGKRKSKARYSRTYMIVGPSKRDSEKGTCNILVQFFCFLRKVEAQAQHTDVTGGASKGKNAGRTRNERAQRWLVESQRRAVVHAV